MNLDVSWINLDELSCNIWFILISIGPLILSQISPANPQASMISTAVESLAPLNSHPSQSWLVENFVYLLDKNILGEICTCNFFPKIFFPFKESWCISILAIIERWASWDAVIDKNMTKLVLPSLNIIIILLDYDY